MKIAKSTLQRIYLLSDTKLLPEAEMFIHHFLKENNPITSTQINGLANIVAATEEISHIERYIRHQQDKAAKNANAKWKNRDYYLMQFFEQLGKKLQELKTFTKNHTEIFYCTETPEDLKKIYYYLIKEFIQHLIVEHNFQAK